MYPELYPEFNGRDRKLRGFALSFAGGLLFIATTVASVSLSSQWPYLVVPGLSLGAVSMIFVAHKSRSFLNQAGLLIGASAALAAETGLVGLLYPVPLAGACCALTLAGGLVAARGLHDFEAIASLRALPIGRRETTAERRTGGE